MAEDIEDESLVQSYYDTPARYFRVLSNITFLDVDYFKISGMNQTSNIVGYAGSGGIHIIAVRVYNSDDYKNLRDWLLEDKTNRVVLFHSASYPFGNKLLAEFASQVSFDDIHPVIT